ncbi:PE_PGRS family protein [Mycobacterium tuberculosis]|nr:PE_PGRS family protein [Mycobacterium tuberculosis]
MSLVIVAPETVAAAALDVARIGSSITTVARAGSAAMDGLAARMARSNSSSHSWVGLRAIRAASRISSCIRGEVSRNATSR